MKGRYECYLDGHALTALDERIILLDIREDAPQQTAALLPCATRDGQLLISRTRQSLTVRAVIEVREYDPLRRSRLIDALCAWAEGRVLTVSYRENQRLHVVCTQRPTVGSALCWTERLTVAFTAFAQPYWEETLPVRTACAAAQHAEMHLRPRGTAPCCFLEADITNASGMELSALRLDVNGRFFALENMALPSGETLRIFYGADGLLRIAAGERSLLLCRTPDSADDLLLFPRRDNLITLDADGPVSAAFIGRGLYL